MRDEQASLEDEREREQPAEPQFCQKCLSTTADNVAWGLFTFNYVCGTRFFGRRDVCPECGSVVRTQWAFFFVPLLPFESYRVLYRSDGAFVGRQTRTCWPQILATYAVSIPLAIALVLLLIWLNKKPPARDNTWHPNGDSVVVQQEPGNGFAFTVSSRRPSGDLGQQWV
jgi:hypothetical protein